MTKGCKMWLWFVFVCGIISMAVYFFMMFVSMKEGLYGMAICAVKIIGVALLLFKQERQGFYLFLAGAFVDLILCVVSGAPATSIVSGFIGAVVSSVITYTFMRKSEGVFQ